MPPTRLILVKHAMPVIEPDGPAREWRLGASGRTGSLALAHLLASYDPAAVITSDEPKAAETGQIVADALGIASCQAPGLHEHERPQPRLMSQAAFTSTLQQFFQQPQALVFGSETAGAACLRFTAALDDVLAAFAHDTLVVVAHGTVISLYVSHLTGLAPFPLWQRLGLPSFVVLNRPPSRVLRVVESVESS